MKMMRMMVLCCVALLGGVAVCAKDAPVQYKIRIDPADLTGFAVEIKIQRQQPGLLRVAMAVRTVPVPRDCGNSMMACSFVA